MAFQENRVKHIEWAPRPANTTTEERDHEGHITKSVKTFRLGAWEIMKVQEGLDNLEPGDRERMAYLEWLLGACENIEVTITATYER